MQQDWLYMEKNEYGRNNNEITNSICNLWNQVDALVKAMKALQQAVKVYHRRVGDLQVRLIYGDSTPTPVLDEKHRKISVKC